jgi:hypothetical protein
MSTKIYIPWEFSTEPISEYASEKKLYEINQRKMRILAIKVSDKYLNRDLVSLILKYMNSIQEDSVDIQTESLAGDDNQLTDFVIAIAHWGEEIPLFKVIRPPWEPPSDLGGEGAGIDLFCKHINDMFGLNRGGENPSWTLTNEGNAPGVFTVLGVMPTAAEVEHPAAQGSEIISEASDFLSKINNTHLLEFYSKLNITEQEKFYKFLREGCGEKLNKAMRGRNQATIIKELVLSPDHNQIFYMRDDQGKGGFLYETDILTPKDSSLYEGLSPPDSAKLSDNLWGYQKYLEQESLPVPKMGHHLSSLLNKWKEGMKYEREGHRKHDAYNNPRLYMTPQEIFELSVGVLLLRKQFRELSNNPKRVRGASEIVMQYKTFLKEKIPETHQALFELLRNNQLYWRLGNGFMIYFIEGRTVDYSMKTVDKIEIGQGVASPEPREEEEEEEEDVF